jgi:hypothetical protein
MYKIVATSTKQVPKKTSFSCVVDRCLLLYKIRNYQYIVRYKVYQKIGRLLLWGVISVGATRRCSIHQRASSLCFLVSCFPQARNWSRLLTPLFMSLFMSLFIRPIYFSEASFIATRMMCTLLQPTRSYTNPCLLKAILVNSF